MTMRFLLFCACLGGAYGITQPLIDDPGEAGLAAWPLGTAFFLLAMWLVLRFRWRGAAGARRPD